FGAAVALARHRRSRRTAGLVETQDEARIGRAFQSGVAAEIFVARAMRSARAARTAQEIGSGRAASVSVGKLVVRALLAFGAAVALARDRRSRRTARLVVARDEARIGRAERSLAA